MLIENMTIALALQLMLSHRSPAITERYLRLTITDLKETYARLRPRERA
jgi:site-specific recombinase XerD